MKKLSYFFLIAAFAVTVLAGCSSSPKYSAPEQHAGSDAAWKFFRGNEPGSTGVSAEEVAPPLAVMWEFEAGGAFRSSPVVADGIVVAGSQDGFVYALNVETGEQIWKYQTADTITASPLILGEKVFIGSHDAKMYVLDLKTGRNLMEPEPEVITAAPVEPESTGEEASESAQPEFEIPSADNASGGTEEDPYEKYMGNAQPVEPVEPTPQTAPQDPHKKIVTGPGIEIKRGIKGGAATDGKRVFFGSLDRNVYAVDAQTYEILWTFETKDMVEGVPAVNDGKVFIGSNDGVMYALNAEDGEVLWSYETSDPVYSTPAISGDKLFFTSWDGNLYALNPNNGALRWKQKIDDQVSASPAVSGNRVYVGGAFEGDFVALDASTGEKLWSLKTHGGFDAGAVISGAYVYVGSYDMHLYALNAETGEVVWKQHIRDWIRGSVAVANNTVFSGNGGNKLIAFVTAAK